MMFNKTGQTKAIGAAVLCAATLAAQPSVAAENTITLTARDSSHAITGTFVAYEDGIYAIDTKIGPLLFLASFMRCQGAACPSPADVNADIAR